MADSHTRRTLAGVAWNFLRVFGQMALLFAVNAVLARLLSPAAFGLLTSVMIVIGFADLVASLGMNPAIVQRPTLTDRHLRVATTLSLLVGSLLLGALLLAAPAIAALLGVPEMTLPVRVLAFGLWFTALAAPSRGMLIRAMDFRSLLVIELGSYALGYAGVGITLALLDFGAWSLIIGSLVTLVCSALAAMLVAPPRLPLSLAARETRELMGFGSGMSLNSVINYLAANVDYATISRYIGPAALGLYGQAYRLISLPVSKIAGTLSSAMFPSFSEIRGDTARLRRAYLRAVGATALVTFPVLIGSLAAAETVITGFFGEQWRSASLAFRILALAGMLKAIFHLAGPLAQASGRVSSEIWRQGVYLVVLTAGCVLGLPFGIEGVSCAVVIGSLWMYLAMARLALDIVAADWQDFFLAQRPGLIVGTLTGGVAVALELANRELLHLPAPLMLMAVVAACAACSAVCVLYLPATIIGDLPAWLLDHSRDKLPRALGAWLGRRLGVD